MLNTKFLHLYTNLTYTMEKGAVFPLFYLPPIEYFSKILVHKENIFFYFCSFCCPKIGSSLYYPETSDDQLFASHYPCKSTSYKIIWDRYNQQIEAKKFLFTIKLFSRNLHNAHSAYSYTLCTLQPWLILRHCVHSEK